MKKNGLIDESGIIRSKVKAKCPACGEVNRID